MQDGEQWWREVEQQIATSTPVVGPCYPMHATVEQFCLSEAESWEDEAVTHCGETTAAEGVNWRSRDGSRVKRGSVEGDASEPPRKMNRPG